MLKFALLAAAFAVTLGDDLHEDDLAEVPNESSFADHLLQEEDAEEQELIGLEEDETEGSGRVMYRFKSPRRAYRYLNSLYRRGFKPTQVKVYLTMLYKQIAYRWPRYYIKNLVRAYKSNLYRIR